MPPRPTKWIKRSIRPEPLLSPSVMQGRNGNTPAAQQNQLFGPANNQPISAFRAVNSTAQSLPANAASGVLFQNEQFDLANEYNPNTSTFTPRTTGVYSLIASVEFQTTAIVDFTFEVVFLVNQDVVGGDNEFRGGALPAIVTINDILQLNAGDTVTVAMRSTAAGAVQVSTSTHFAAARLPSPTA
ncbi:C1q-like domain-containing protein [Bacillus atrophaeus]|uniref:C1q-like domain-containing protein n=1 Tax=Bacillus atrophaeus TaxID=1452 RepID=UPI0038737E7C